MKASAIAENIYSCIKMYGDRDIKYLGKLKNEDGTTFYEDITTISFSAKLNGKLLNEEQLINEPFVLIGNSFFVEKKHEKKLTWFGKLFKKFIFKNER